VDPQGWRVQLDLLVLQGRLVLQAYLALVVCQDQLAHKVVQDHQEQQAAQDLVVDLVPKDHKDSQVV